MIESIYYEKADVLSDYDFKLLKLTIFSFTVEKKKFLLEVNNLLTKLYNNINFYRKRKM